MPRHLLKYAFVILVGWPVMRLWLRLRVRSRERLPLRGPAIVVANHNSHLDTLALLVLFPLSLLPGLRPVAAADYFLRSRLLAWFACNVIGVIPVERGGHEQGSDPLADCHAALERGEILIIFPEGTRGVPEQLLEFKCGIAYLAERHADIPLIPVFMHGFGLSMPRGAVFPAPRVADVLVGENLRFTGDRASFMAALRRTFERLSAKLQQPAARITEHGATPCHR